MSDVLLELTGVGKRYGELVVLDDVSFSVKKGARHALIGPNGAGKSTLFNVVSGTARCSAGAIRLRGVDVTRQAEHRRAKLGVSRTFQQTSLFERTSVAANVEIAVQQQKGFAYRPWPSPRRAARARERARELVDLVGLADSSRMAAGALSHGQRRQLDVALSLATEPALVLMDEPTAGMSNEEARSFLTMIATLPESLTILVVDHDMDVIFELATWITVLDAGRLIADGTPTEIRGSDAVQEAYLGPGERTATLLDGD